VERVLRNVCPNCGGGFAPRPVRPVNEWRPGLSLALRPAGTARHRATFSPEEVAAFSSRIAGIPPDQR
jgi:hypothetical protein